MERNPFLSKIFKLFRVLVLSTLIFNVLVTPQVEAQGVAGFSQCQFNEGTNSSDAIGQCIRQVLQFALIVGVFVALFRIGYVAFQSSNPFGGGGTTADMVKALRDFGIGILILGGPVIVLNTINPALLNFDFLSGIVNLTGSQSNNGSNSNNGSGSNSSTTITGSNANLNGTSPSDLAQAVETIQSDPANQQARETIEKVLQAQRRCSGLFVTNFNECKTIEDPGFQEALNQVPQDIQQTLGGSAAPETDFNGNFTPTQDIVIDNSGSSGFQLNNRGCKVFNIQVTSSVAAASNSTLQIEKCNNTVTSDLFKIGSTGDIEINSNIEIKAGTTINETNAVFIP